MIDEPNKELETIAMNDEDFDSVFAKFCEILGEDSQSDEDYLKEMLSAEEAPSEELTAPKTPDYADRHRNAAPVKKDHSIRNLTVLVVLEVLGIIGVALWWVLRLL